MRPMRIPNRTDSPGTREKKQAEIDQSIEVDVESFLQYKEVYEEQFKNLSQKQFSQEVE